MKRKRSTKSASITTKNTLRVFHEHRNDVVYDSGFGSIGTTSTKTIKFFDENGIDRLLAENIILETLGIIHHHIYAEFLIVLVVVIQS